MQQRLPKFKRAPEAMVERPVTDRSLVIIETIARYRFLKSSDIIRLVGGNEDVTYRHLQQLYHRDFVSRLALPKNGGHGEFIYFLDNSTALRQLAKQSKLDPKAFDWNAIKANRERYREPSPGSIGRLLFVEHELMISGFRATFEIECAKSRGRVILSNWIQGSGTWNSVQDRAKALPHRPDAFFSLEFPNAAPGQTRSNFFYEADRSTSNLARMSEKLKAHVLFLLQKQHVHYGVQKIRAVLIHTTSENRARQLEGLAAQLATKEPLAAHLFWFASSEELATGTILEPHFSLCTDSRKRSLLD